MANALFRLAASFVRPPRQTGAGIAVNENLPAYSVIVALYQEAGIVPQLLRALMALNYPRDRLEILFALEADDRETLAAFEACQLPAYARVVRVPPGTPRTKPRALNHALEQACGDLIVIYDAEDRPAPEQLREAARAFAAGATDLACLQAPLRPAGGQGFIARQFTAEYAVQFDILLPALNALRLPFPLGGTSNHFRADILRQAGGWDAFNVTEDADLGFRLARLGYRTGLIMSPTVETPPTLSRIWLPQRTRWIKGYMQTLCVHTRLATGFQPHVWTGLCLGVGLSIAAALVYAPFTFLICADLLLAGLQQIADPAHPLLVLNGFDLTLFLFGTLSGQIALALGARRAGIQLSALDIIGAPFYWCLQSVAALFASYQLIAKPFHWDKTEHAPDTETPVFAPRPLYEGQACAYGLGHDHYRYPDHIAHPSLG
ncbi:MAG: glycosyltransferase [Asticcacaulis sp.]|uniref:glycosyltransferase n=1 Tax=Asticcacaulis sp. TaxID=1872648 RepID=UPI0039E41450